MNYRDRLYREYASGHTESLYGKATVASIRAQYSAWAAYFRDFLPWGKEARILDLGCGDGGFVMWLRESGYFTAEGIDVSSEQISKGVALGIKGLREANIEDFLPAHRGEYDAIIARDVLEHFKKEELLPILEEVFYALKPGGVFIAQTVNGESPFWGRLRHADFTHEGAFTKTSLSQVLRVVGFNKFTFIPQRPVVHGLVSFIRTGIWRIVEFCYRIILLAETGSGDAIFTQNLIVRAQKKSLKG